VVAVAGKREQALRFDPFSMGAHYHIRPGRAAQIPLPVAEGQSPLDATMAFFEKPLRFRGLLALAEEDDVASGTASTNAQGAIFGCMRLASAVRKFGASTGFCRDGMRVPSVGFNPLG